MIATCKKKKKKKKNRKKLDHSLTVHTHQLNICKRPEYET